MRVYFNLIDYISFATSSSLNCSNLALASVSYRDFVAASNSFHMPLNFLDVSPSDRPGFSFFTVSLWSFANWKYAVSGFFFFGRPSSSFLVLVFVFFAVVVAVLFFVVFLLY